MPAHQRRGSGGARPGSGPKPKALDELRRNRVVLNLTDDELGRLAAAAKGERLSEFARHMLFRSLARRR